MSDAFSSLPDASRGAGGYGSAMSAQTLSEVLAPPLPDLGPATGVPAGANRMLPTRDLSLLADIPVEVAVEIGRLRMPLRDLLSLEPGAVLELDRAADAPVDVLVNGRLVARGEVVVIDGEFGVRVTDLVERAGELPKTEG
jgi:flagellar motor switch protein FliN/FliY